MKKLNIQVLKRNFPRSIKNIGYMDETYIHPSHTHNKTWGDNTNKGFHKPVSKGQRMVIVHAGGEMNFIKNAYLEPSHMIIIAK